MLSAIREAGIVGMGGAAFPGSRNFVAALRRKAAEQGIEITTVVQNINPRRTSAVLGSAEKVQIGRAHV